MLKRVMGFFKSEEDTNQAIVKSFYIVGTELERMAKCLELKKTNPNLTNVSMSSDENFSATTMQLSDKPIRGGQFEDTIDLANQAQQRGEDSVFRISPPVRDFERFMQNSP